MGSFFLERGPTLQELVGLQCKRLKQKGMTSQNTFFLLLLARWNVVSCFSPHALPSRQMFPEKLRSDVRMQRMVRFLRDKLREFDVFEAFANEQQTNAPEVAVQLVNIY